MKLGKNLTWMFEKIGMNMEYNNEFRILLIASQRNGCTNLLAALRQVGHFDTFSPRKGWEKNDIDKLREEMEEVYKDYGLIKFELEDPVYDKEFFQGLIDVAKELKCDFLFSRRENLFKRCISLEIKNFMVRRSYDRGHFDLKNADLTIDEIPIQKIKDDIDYINKMNRFFKEMFDEKDVDYKEMVYEDLYDKNSEIQRIIQFNKILDYLNLNNFDINDYSKAIRTFRKEKKLNDSEIYNKIENIEEIRKEFNLDE